MSDVTEILKQIEQGDPAAWDRLLPLVYDELHKLAAIKLSRERPGQTLQATALINEVYMRWLGAEKSPMWNSHEHFFYSAALTMKRILLKRAKAKMALKRGRGWKRLDIDTIDLALNTPDEAMLALDEAIDRLAAENPEAAKLFILRFFAGLTIESAAKEMNTSRSTADRLWKYARAWLGDYFGPDEDDSA